MPKDKQKIEVVWTKRAALSYEKIIADILELWVILRRPNKALTNYEFIKFKKYL